MNVLLKDVKDKCDKLCKSENITYYIAATSGQSFSDLNSYDELLTLLNSTPTNTNEGDRGRNNCPSPSCGLLSVYTMEIVI